MACSEEGRAATPLYSDHKGPDGLSYTWYVWDGLKEETVTYSKWPVIPTRPDPPKEEVKTLQEEPKRRRRKRKNRRKEGGRSRKEEAAVRAMDDWWAANFGIKKKMVHIILDNIWKEATARRLNVPLSTSSSPSNPSSSPSNLSYSPSSPHSHPSSPSNPSSSPWSPSFSPPHPSSTPTRGWVPPLPPSPYLSWRSLAADMRWGCVKSALRVLRGGAPAPPSCSPPAPLPSGASAPAAPPTAGETKVIKSNSYYF